ncbi:MAG: 8-amino-7-oxononanoate synthase [Burkholderiales bacterium]
MNSFEDKLRSLHEQGLMRQRRTVEGPQEAVLTVDGQKLLAFASNDYLGLANHPDLIQAAHRALDHFGVGAGASALISGHSEPVAALESTLAQWLDYGRALHFSTGYMANLGIIPALVSPGAAVFSDALNHACLIDGIRLSRASDVTIYEHGDMARLEQALKQSRVLEKWIVTDAVFSMDGDVAPLNAIVALAEQYDAQVLVDDAHGFGVLGEAGRGTLNHLGIRSPRIVYMATLGKAAGVYGAFVAASAEVIEWLVQRARTYIFTTGTPPVLAAACLASIQRIQQDEFRRVRLRELGVRLQEGLKCLPWPALPSVTAIHPVVLGDNFTVTRIADALRDRGFWVPAIRPPTVQEGAARLRISLSANHSLAQVDALLAALRALA